MKLFNEYGISFEYPDAWELTKEVDETNGEIQISVNSENSSFWMISLFLVDVPPEMLLKGSLDVFRDEYDEIDIYERNTELAGQTCLGRDIEFVCSELINSAFLRVFKTELFTAFVLYQGTDQELDSTKKDLEAISASLDVFNSGFEGYLDIV